MNPRRDTANTRVAHGYTAHLPNGFVVPEADSLNGRRGQTQGFAAIEKNR